MIRNATEADIPRLVEMGCRFRQESSYAKVLTENPEQMAKLGRILLASDGLILSEREGKITGMMGFIVHDHFLSGERVAGEVFWWVEPEYRGDGLRLLKEAERRAKLAGASQMQMIAPTEQVEMVYLRFGYHYVEATYQKTL